MIVVGIDQALRKIGLCVIQDGAPVYLSCIKTPQKLTGPERLTWLRNALLTFLTPFAPFDAAALEGQSLGSPGDINQLGQINGVVKVALADLRAAKIYEVAPASLKKFVTGSSLASKKQMLENTLTHYGLQIDNDDIGDAHGLARIAWEAQQPWKSLPRHQLEVLHNLLHKKPRKPRRKKIVCEANL